MGLRDIPAFSDHRSPINFPFNFYLSCTSFGASKTCRNPTLDIDATQGWGPENVNLDDPKPGIDYAVGVYYFTDRGYGPSIATVRIFFEGFLHTELTSPAFQTGQFWDALRLRWEPNEVDAVDEIHDGFP